MERGRETGRDHVRLYQEENHPRQTSLRRWNPFPEHPSVCAWVCVLQKLCHISIFLPIQVKVQIKIWNTETGSQTRGWRTACKTTQQTLMWKTVELQPSANVSWVEDQMQCEITNPFLMTDCPVVFCLLNFHYLRSHASKTSELN